MERNSALPHSRNTSLPMKCVLSSSEIRPPIWRIYFFIYSLLKKRNLRRTRNLESISDVFRRASVIGKIECVNLHIFSYSISLSVILHSWVITFRRQPRSRCHRFRSFFIQTCAGECAANRLPVLPPTLHAVPERQREVATENRPSTVENNRSAMMIWLICMILGSVCLNFVEEPHNWRRVCATGFTRFHASRRVDFLACGTCVLLVLYFAYHHFVNCVLLYWEI